MNINLRIAGGCFTEQHNIAFDKLYHQIVKGYIKKNFHIDLNINIIRYERFANCFDKIKKSNIDNPIDILLFHIRSEQYLRLAKLYYKFSDENGKKRHTLNLPLFKILNPEKYDLLQLIRRSSSAACTDYNLKQTSLHNFLVSMNYLAGLLSGNTYFALKNYFNLLNLVIDYCTEKNIKLIVVGPASRPHTKFENFLTSRLNSFMINSIDTKKVKYIKCLGNLSENNKSLFFENGIYVNEEGHQRIGGLIINSLIELFTDEYFMQSINRRSSIVNQQL